MAESDMPKLNVSLNQGLDAGLTISEVKEILVQLYAYAGFPKSLNASGELMKVVDARKQRGIPDAPGREPSRAIPTGGELCAVGTANQTKISGAPVKNAVTDFASAINQFLQAYVNLMDRSSAEIVLAQLPDAFMHFNEVHPYSSLKWKSPRMFRRELARRAQESGAN
jgi:transposase InsO family protein